MVRALRRSIPLVVLAVLGCPGDRGATKDATPPSSDTAIADTRPAASDGVTRDGTGAGKEASPGKPCASWADWTCKEGAVNLCEATCTKGGPLQLSCIKGGACLCGLSLGPCGTFSVTANPCDTCKQAVEQSCCDPKPPDAGPKPPDAGPKKG